MLTKGRAGLRSKHSRCSVFLRLPLRSEDDLLTIAKVIEYTGFVDIDIRAGFSSMPRAKKGASVPD